MIAAPSASGSAPILGGGKHLLLFFIVAAGYAALEGQADAAQYTFASAGPIQIQDFSPALPYPALINVANVTGVVAKVTVTLNKLTHTRPSDVDILLVGPSGQSVVLLSDAGGFSAVTDVTITFDDSALAPEREFDPLVSGSFQPVNYGLNDNFPSPAPNTTPGPALSVFRGTNPNGDWRLFVVDDEFGEAGQISDGWSLTITAHSQDFAFPAEITIPALGPAAPYPAALVVSGVAGPITKLTVTLNNLEHTFPADLDVLLVGPGGASAILMSDAGAGFDVSGVTLTFDDSALDLLPDNAALASGRFRPTNYGTGDSFDPPAPIGPYGDTLSVFNGTDANGVWQLFVIDDSPQDSGRFVNGWQLSISTENLVIVEQPETLTSVLGGAARLAVSAGGVGPLMYQWRLNGAIIAGATNSTLILPNLQVQDFGSYSVTVANQLDAITSEQTPLLLAAPTLAPSDSLASAVPLGVDSGLIRGTNLFAGKEAGEPNHAGKPGGKSVWYDWTPHVAGVATVSTKGSGFDTLLAVYTGSGFANLPLVVRDDDRGGFFTSSVRFNVLPGQTYHIAIDGLGGDEGTFLLQWGLDAGVPLLPVISTQPVSQSVTQGTLASFSVNAAGGGVSYQWFFFTNLIPGATGPTLTVPNVQAGDVGTYTVRVSNPGQFLVSESVLLEIGPLLGFQSGKLPEILMAESTSGFIPVRAGQITLSQVLNNTDPGGGTRDPNSCGTSPKFTRWIGLAPEEAGEFEIDTKGSSIPTVLTCYHVFDATRLAEVACDKSDLVSMRACHVQFKAHPLTNYMVKVDGLDGMEGSISVNWKFGVHLSATRSNQSCVLSWCAPNGSYQLQSAPEAKKSPAWANSSSAVTFDRGTNRVTVSIPSPPAQRIFRLNKK